MALILNLYPTLTDTIFSSIGYLPTDYEFYYYDDDDKRRLTSEHPDMASTSSYHIKVSDNSGMWNPSQHSIYAKRTLSIMNSDFLFGKNGIVGSNAEVGLALQWMCKSSNRRGTKILGSFKKGMSNINIGINCHFERGTLADSVILQTILYLKEAGKIERDEISLATDSGTVLGVLDEYNIIIEGKGSIFPIIETNKKSAPLWWVEANWEDPLIDSFSEENVSIVINRGHKNYADLALNKGIKDSPLFLEILSSALHLIILKAKEGPDWNSISKGENIDSGSIGEAIYYFIKTFGWNDCDNMRLAFLIRNSLYSKFKGDKQ